MANNCLIAKLKGSDQNDNLPLYGFYKLHVNTNVELTGDTESFRRIVIQSYSPTIVKVVGNGTFDVLAANGTTVLEQSVTEATLAADWRTVRVNNGEYDLLIERYKTARFQYGNTSSRGTSYVTIKDPDDVSALSFSTARTIVYMSNLKGTFNLANANLAILDNLVVQPLNNEPINYDASININPLENCLSLRTLSVIKMANALGNITSLTSTALTNISIAGCSKITGDLKTFAENQVTAGRVSGSVYVQAYDSGITVDGVAYNDYVASHGGTYYLNIVFDSSVPGGYSIGVE